MTVTAMKRVRSRMTQVGMICFTSWNIKIVTKITHTFFILLTLNPMLTSASS